MQYADLVAHFGGPSDAADALGIDDRQTVHSWKTRRIPSKWQMKAQAITGGKLTADAQARSEAEELAGYLEQVRAAT
jgi:hypothetical protein